MIDKVANNKSNREKLNLNPIEKIAEKLDYYRSLFGKTHDLPERDFKLLISNIQTFFNLKPVRSLKEPPERLVRISNNNRVLASQGKELSYLTDISQILAPPKEFCTFGRCNLPKQQVLYCATDLPSAYWETKPQRGDVITISHFKLKEGAKIICTAIDSEKTEDQRESHQLAKVFDLLNHFFIDAFSLEVERKRPRDYIFSALLSSEQLFHLIPSDINIEAVLYPSVQRRKFGDNFAIKNDLVLEKYDLIGVETRFILDEYETNDPSSSELTTDNLIGSFGTDTFDFHEGKILYDGKVDEIFKLFRELQTGKGKQVRYDNPENIKTLTFNLSPKNQEKAAQPKPSLPNRKIGRNERVNVRYTDGTTKENMKYKHVKADIENGMCKIIELSE